MTCWPSDLEFRGCSLGIWFGTRPCRCGCLVVHKGKEALQSLRSTVGHAQVRAPTLGNGDAPRSHASIAAVSSLIDLNLRFLFLFLFSRVSVFSFQSRCCDTAFLSRGELVLAHALRFSFSESDVLEFGVLNGSFTPLCFF